MSTDTSLWRERYEPLGIAGQGGQGSVLRARDHQHDRLVALKVRPAGAGIDRAKLLSEARVLLGLRPHPNLPLVRDDFFHDEQYVIVMDWIEGVDLAQLLSDRGDPGLPLETVIRYLEPVADALDHLHAHKPPIIHGDVKPANLILTADEIVQLVDFGVSAPVGAGDSSGSRGYRAPEIAAGATASAASDIYAFAATAFALLTGHAPTGERPSWDGLDPATVSGVERAIRRALSVEPARRPGSAGEFLNRLRSARGAQLPTGVVTFLLTDIESSSALWESDADAMSRALAVQETLIAEIVEGRGGRLVKWRGEGDSTLSAFARATDAVEAAIDIQHAIAAEAWPGDLEMRVRIALHTGQAELRERDYFGQTLNRASRIRGVAHGGEILLSQATTEVVSDSLPHGVELVDRGMHELKGLGRWEHVYEVRLSGLQPVRLEPIPASVGPVSLPLQRTSFIGREREIAQLLGLLSDARLVTLTGAGGSGKTRLAIEVATRDASRHPDGTFFVDLAPVTSADGVLDAFANAVTARGDPSDLQAMVLNHLSGRDALIVLDNCEQVIDASAGLVDLVMSECPDVHILATSRTPLQLDCEQNYRVPTLPADDERSASVQLFASRARAVDASFELTRHNVGTVAQICRRLDGLPLALELAAARVRSMTVREIAERLDDRFRLLMSGSRTAVPRQRTLEAAVSWSYELLSPAERVLFDRLAIFAGGWSLDAAEQVCADEALERPEIGDLLASLIERSLVLRDETADGRSRYRMLETLRQFARDRLLASGSLDALRDRHLAWAAALSESSPVQTGQPPPPELAIEADNIRVALEWALEGGAHEAGLRIICNLWVGHLDERTRLLKRFLPFVEQAPLDIQCKVLFAAGTLAFMTGDWQWGIETLGRAHEVGAVTGDDLRAAMSLTYGGACWWGLGDTEAALELLDRGIAFARAAQNDQAIARGLISRTWLEIERDPQRAQELAQEGEQIAEELGLTFDFGHYREVRGFISCLLNRYDEGARTLGQALRLFENAEVNCGSHILETVAAWAVIAGRFELAAEILGSAHRVAEETGAKPRPWEARVRRDYLSLIPMRLEPEVYEASYRRGHDRAFAEALAFAERSLLETTARGVGPQAVRVSLPAPRTSFVGRVDELGDSLAALTKSRLVTLTGVGGTGKTRLAIEAAKRDAARHRDGVFFVDLAPHTDGENVATAVASALNAQGDASDVDEMVLTFLTTRKALIVLDNCEHVIDVCARLVDRILATCGSISVLATSREPLQIECEKVIRVPPMDAGDGSSDAVELFVTRARSVNERFRLDETNSSVVLDICKRLDGIPLAIELAASRVDQHSVADIAERLSKRFRLLVGGRDRPERQQTLQTAIDSSWELLSDAEKEVFRRLAVFAGTFSLEAAEGICGPSTIDVIGPLVKKSLVVLDDDTGHARYRLLETVRLYASERLVEAGEADVIRDAHRDWYLNWSEALSTIDYFDARYVNAFTREYTNIRAAMDRSAEQARPDLLARQLLTIGTAWQFDAAMMEESRAALREVGSNELLSAATRADAFAAMALVSMYAGDVASVYPAAQRSLDLDATDRRYLPAALFGTFRYAEAAEAARRLDQPTFARFCRVWDACFGIIVDARAALERLKALAMELDRGASGWDSVFTHTALVVTKVILDDEPADADVERARVAWQNVSFGDEPKDFYGPGLARFDSSIGAASLYGDILEAVVHARSRRFDAARGALLPITEATLRDRFPLVAFDCLIAFAYIAFREGDATRAALLLEPVTADGRARMLPMGAFGLWLLTELNGSLAAQGVETPLPDRQLALMRTQQLLTGKWQEDRSIVDRIYATLAHEFDRAKRATNTQEGTAPA